MFRAVPAELNFLILRPLVITDSVLNITGNWPTFKYPTKAKKGIAEFLLCNNTDHGCFSSETAISTEIHAMRINYQFSQGNNEKSL